MISTYLSNTIAIGWAIRGNVGVLFNPANNSTLGLLADVPSTVEHIGGNSLLVRGVSGLAITQNLTQSTYAGQDSDSYAVSQLLDGVEFLPSIVVS